MVGRGDPIVCQIMQRVLFKPLGKIRPCFGRYVSLLQPDMPLHSLVDNRVRDLILAHIAVHGFNILLDDIIGPFPHQISKLTRRDTLS